MVSDTAQMVRNNAGMQIERPALSQREFEVDLHGFLSMIWRHRGVVLLSMMAGLFIAAAMIYLIPETYKARSVILIEQKGSAPGLSADIGAMIGGGGDASVLSDIEVLRSRMMAHKIVQHLELYRDPEFMSGLRVTETMRDEEIAEIAEIVVSRFLKKMSVSAVPGASAVQVIYEAEHPKKAAVIANVIADLFIEYRTERKQNLAEQRRDWLEVKLSDLQGDMQRLEQDIQRFRRDKNIVEGTRSVLSAEQISNLNAQYMQAQAQQADAKAKIEQGEALLAAGKDLSDVPAMLETPSVRSLQEAIIAQKRSISDLSVRYGPKHPLMQSAQAELESLQDKLKGEISNTIDGFYHAESLAASRAAAISAQIASASEQRIDDGDVMLSLQGMERKSQAMQRVYEDFLTAYEHSKQQAALQDAGAYVISRAVAPGGAAYPNKGLIFALCSLAFLALGIFWAALRDMLDNRFRSVPQLEQVLKLPCLGLVPRMSSSLSKAALGRYVIDHPSSFVAESVRALRSDLALKVGGSHAGGQVVSLTSSFPGEGKTLLAVWMARLAARSGERVILIDTDLRRPNVDKTMGQSFPSSIVDYLRGDMALEDVVQTDPESGAHVILSHSVPETALDLVGSPRFKILVEALRQEYDLVILDTPAALAVSDARLIARLADVTLYGVAWAKTKIDAAAHGVKQFKDLGIANVFSVMLKIDLKRGAEYNYGAAVRYYRK
jgi:uncharacterized protein involved in exopolysaccharide biosynthesis/Mrp family chromosome partitioning ATPase